VYPCKNKIKVVDLLTHRSGYTYYARNGSNWLFNLHTDLVPDYINTSRFDNLDDFSKAVAKQPLDFEPGTMYTYGLNQAILGRLIEVISGKSFYGFLKENIFDKLGMNDTKFHLTEDDRLRFQPLRVNIKPRTPFNQTEYNLDEWTEFKILKSNILVLANSISGYNDNDAKYLEDILNKLGNNSREILKSDFDLFVSSPEIKGRLKLLDIQIQKTKHNISNLNKSEGLEELNKIFVFYNYSANMIESMLIDSIN